MNFLDIFIPSVFMFLLFKTDFIVDSVFSILFLDSLIAAISCFETFVYAYFISFLETRNDLILAPLNFLSYFLMASSPSFCTFFIMDSTICLFF